jgi:hypothetical protein
MTASQNDQCEERNAATAPVVRRGWNPTRNNTVPSTADVLTRFTGDYAASQDGLYQFLRLRL